jgi:hypothetical protein
MTCYFTTKGTTNLFEFFKRLTRNDRVGRSFIDENGLQIVSTLSANDRGEVRAYVQEFMGHELAHVRYFMRDKEGRARPTKKGIAVDVRELPRLAEAVDALLAAAGDRR